MAAEGEVVGEVALGEMALIVTDRPFLVVIGALLVRSPDVGEVADAAGVADGGGVGGGFGEGVAPVDIEAVAVADFYFRDEGVVPTGGVVLGIAFAFDGVVMQGDLGIGRERCPGCSAEAGVGVGGRLRRRRRRRWLRLRRWRWWC